MSHKRITARQLASDENATAATAIAGDERRGIIDGVEVDFRHPHLAPSDWEPLPQWYVGGPPPSHTGAVFPSEWSHPDWASLSENRGDELVYLHSGDRLSIESVVPVIGDSRFEHPHDSQLRQAYLKIERPSGEAVAGLGPLAFYGRTKIREGPTREAFDHILERICLHAGRGLYDRNDMGYWRWSDPLEEIARQLGAEAHDAYFRLLEQLPAGQARAQLRILANQASLSGFLLAKAEAREPTSRAERQIDSAKMAAADKTPPALLAKARELSANNPGWSRSKLAQELEPVWNRDRRSIARTLKAHGIGPDIARRR